MLMCPASVLVRLLGQMPCWGRRPDERGAGPPAGAGAGGEAAAATSRAARLPDRAARVRGAARSAAAPVQDARDRHPHIPIAFVTEKYLEYLETMQSMSVEVAAEYLVMAATLAYLKSRELVPNPEPLEGAGRGRRGGARPARGADPPAARVPEVQGRGREAGRAAHRGAQRLRAGHEAGGRARHGRAGRTFGLEADRVVRATCWRRRARSSPTTWWSIASRSAIGSTRSSTGWRRAAAASGSTRWSTRRLPEARAAPPAGGHPAGDPGAGQAAGDPGAAGRRSRSCSSSPSARGRRWTRRAGRRPPRSMRGVGPSEPEARRMGTRSRESPPRSPLDEPRRSGSRPNRWREPGGGRIRRRHGDVADHAGQTRMVMARRKRGTPTAEGNAAEGNGGRRNAAEGNAPAPVKPRPRPSSTTSRGPIPTSTCRRSDTDPGGRRPVLAENGTAGRGVSFDDEPGENPGAPTGDGQTPDADAAGGFDLAPEPGQVPTMAAGTTWPRRAPSRGGRSADGGRIRRR